MGQFYLKTKEEIEKIRKSSLLVGEVLAEVAKLIAPGVKTSELDRVAEAYIRDCKAIPALKVIVVFRLACVFLLMMPLFMVYRGIMRLKMVTLFLWIVE